MFLNSNPNPSLKVSNGSRGRMHSIHYSDGMAPSLIQRIIQMRKRMQSGDYTNTMLEIPIPDAVLLELENDRRGNILYPTKIEKRNYKTMVPGKETFTLGRHDFQPGFSYTIYKAQGLTIAFIILAAYLRPGKMYKFLMLKLHDLYVALSRVRAHSNFRLLGSRRQGTTKERRFRHLTDLKQCTDLQEWDENYDGKGM